jgi:hypothetical protein
VVSFWALMLAFCSIWVFLLLSWNLGVFWIKIYACRWAIWRFLSQNWKFLMSFELKCENFGFFNLKFRYVSGIFIVLTKFYAWRQNFYRI